MRRRPTVCVTRGKRRALPRASAGVLLDSKLPSIVAGLSDRTFVGPPFAPRPARRRASRNRVGAAGPIPLPFYSEPRPHAHEHVEIALVLEGRAYVEIMGVGSILKRGTVVLFPPGVPHYDSYVSRGTAYTMLWYVLWPGNPRMNVSGYDPRAGFELRVVYDMRSALVPPDDWRFAGSLSAAQSVDVGRLRQFLFSLYSATLEASRRVGPIKPVEAARKAVSDAVAFLRSRMSEGPTVEMAAEYVGLSPTYLTTIVRKELGHPLHEVLSDMRMERARRLLGQSRLSIKEIAAECGFSSADYFSRAFGAAEGCSPRAYRRQFVR